MLENRFQVNLRGIIALLSDNLYSGPQVFVRELLQNAVDAISARQLLDGTFASGCIDIEVYEAADAATVIVQDNGVGLSEDDVHQFLATIGASSKRDDLGKARADFIGQFGIGLLSCFMVADEIVVITRAATAGARPVEWRGRHDGTYSVRAAETDMAPGTRVYLRARPDMRKWCTAAEIRRLIQFFGALLPVPIRMQTAGRGQVQINRDPPAWRCAYDSLEQARRAMLDYGRQVFGEDFVDVIPLQSIAGDVDGLAFVLPYSPSPAAKSQHRVYLKNMLLSESAEGVLPDWAFFVRCVVNANGLRPNASREGFYEDAALEQSRQQLGQCLRDYLLRLGRQDPQRLTQLIGIHVLAIKALAVHDDEFYRIFIDWIPFETSAGVMTLGEYRRQNAVVRYAPTVDQFRQVARVAASQQLCVINAGYTYNEKLLEKLPGVFPEISVEEVDASLLARAFGELTMAERNRCFNLIRVADAVLQPFRCAAEVVKFEPSELATLYNTSRDASLFRSVEQSKQVADPHWSDVLGNVFTDAGSAVPYARLFLNYRNPMIRRLAAIEDAKLLRGLIEMLYVQSLLLGMHPLSARELELLNRGLLGLIETALGPVEANDDDKQSDAEGETR
jgi:molecular chaperone HtpG